MKTVCLEWVAEKATTVYFTASAAQQGFEPR